MEKKISYLTRNYDDAKNALINLSKTYYPDLAISYNDASVGSWLIDLNAVAIDELAYHTDRVYQETNIESAQEKNSVFNLARNNGLKVPGPKGAMAEVKFSIKLPISGNVPDWSYAPVIRRGTKVSSSSQVFELLEDVDFSKQFDTNGNSNRTITPSLDSNGRIIMYTVTKLAVVVAGESRIYKATVESKDIKPFMEILLPYENVLNVESIVVRDGNALQSNPTLGMFYSEEEEICGGDGGTRYFEVDSLAQQERWATSGDASERYEYGYVTDEGTVYPTYSVARGEWKPLTHKFITEYTDRGYMKIIFGSGLEEGLYPDISDAASFSKYQMTKILRNNTLGVLPKAGSTVFVLYRIGGGKRSNVATGAINTIAYLNYEARGDKSGVAAVRNSLTVTNTTPSVSGKDMPTTDELRYLIKYNSAAQERCITTKDYYQRVMMLPPKYGTPFRIGVMEDNNKIMLYLLGIDYLGHLDPLLPDVLIENIQDYLANYRSINDYVEIKPGRITNLAFEVDVYIDKNYNKADVESGIRNAISDYMSIDKHQMGDHIFVGDLIKEISKSDGVVNLVDLRVYNEVGGKYSLTQTTQETVSNEQCIAENDTHVGLGTETFKIDLKASNMTLFSDGDTMFEVRYPNEDIIINVIEI